MERRVDGLEDGCHHHREGTVDEGAVDDVYLVEAVPEDGYAYGDAYEPDYPQRETEVPDPHPLQGLGADVQQDRAGEQHRTNVGQPFDLLMLHPSRPTVPEVQRDHPREQDTVRERLERGVYCVLDTLQALDAEGVVYGRKPRARPRQERGRDAPRHGHHPV